MANCGGGPGPHIPKDVGGVSHPAIIEVGSLPLRRGAWFVTIAEGGLVCHSFRIGAGLRASGHPLLESSLQHA